MYMTSLLRSAQYVRYTAKRDIRGTYTYNLHKPTGYENSTDIYRGQTMGMGRIGEG